MNATYSLGDDPTATITVNGDRVLLANCCDCEHSDLRALAALRDWLNEQLTEFDAVRAPEAR